MDSPASQLRDKRQFANRAQHFVKRAARAPAFPALELFCLGAAGLAAISGPFGTGQLPLAARATFWIVVMIWSAAKWRLWFAWRVRDRADWLPASAIGAVLLNLPLPLEIALTFRLVGVEAEIGHQSVWLEAMAISAIVFGLAVAIRRVLAKPSVATPRTAPGPLARAGTRIERIGALRAEDHYCRVHLADGTSRLVLCRFSDAVAELAQVDGHRIHRSVWVADWAVERADREGRAWRLTVSGEPFRVSAAHVTEARRRGWLNRR